MKKIGTLNSSISAAIADMGHMDTLAIADAGLPIPVETEKIDIALTNNIPRFLETLETILLELQVEEAIVAEEIVSAHPASTLILEEIKKRLGDTPVTFVSHDTFKQRLPSCRAVVRTGECTPYANIILSSGVIF